MEATKPVIVQETPQQRLSGYERGLSDSSQRIRRAESKTARWRRLALVCGGIAMALVIVVGIETAALYWRH